MRRRSGSSLLLVAMSVLALASGGSAAAEGRAQGGSYRDLVALFEEFRVFHEPVVTDGVPDYTSSAMQRQYGELGGYQRRLETFSISDWPVSQQIDYHLVRAEMNGLEFYHRVMKPWSTSPDFYWGSPTSTGTPFYGIARLPELPMGDEELEAFRTRLRALPEILAQGRRNIVVADAKRDMALLGIRSMNEEGVTLRDLVPLMREHHPELVADAEAAWAAVQDYRAWIEDNIDRMTAPTGVGVEDYNWWLKNVWLLPYTWDEAWVIARREYDRALATLKLEEYRNRDLPPIDLPATEAEFRRSWAEAQAHLLTFVRESNFVTLPDEVEELAAAPPVPTWLTDPDVRMDIFHQTAARNPVQEVIHEGLTGHKLDQLRPQDHLSPIRATRRLYEMTHPRREGLASGLEEMLMHAGILDDRRRAREIVYIGAAYRGARGLADLMFQANELDYAAAARLEAEMTPYDWAIVDSYAMWDHKRDSVRAPGYEMAYSVGKAQFERLLADRAHQLGENFDMREFMDEFLDAGLMPFALIRWEMTGLTDEVERLW